MGLLLKDLLSMQPLACWQPAPLLEEPNRTKKSLRVHFGLLEPKECIPNRKKANWIRGFLQLMQYVGALHALRLDLARGKT